MGTATASSEKVSAFRSMVRGSSLYLVAVVASRIASVLLLPLSTRFLSPADYGVLDLIDQVNIVLSLLLGGGFGSAFSYFYFKSDSSEFKRQAIGTALVGAFAIGLLSATVGWATATPVSIAVFGSPAYAPYLRLMFVGMPLSFVLEAGFSWLRTEDRAGVFVLFTFIRIALVTAGTVVLLAVFRLGVVGVLYTTIGSVTLLCVAVTIYCIRKSRPLLNRQLFVQMFRYSLPLGLGGIAMFVMHFGDRFILPHYRPLAELGVYGIAYKIAMLISLIYSSFHTYWSTRVFGIVRGAEGQAVLKRLFTYLILMLSVCGLALLVAVKPMLRILTTPAFQAASIIMPLILLAYCFRSIGDFFRCLFLVAGRPGLDAVCTSIGAAICLGGYFALIPAYGMWGAAAATGFAFLCMAVISVVWTYRLHPYEIEGGRLLKLLLAIALPVGVYYMFPVRSLGGQIGFGLLLFASYPLLLLALRFPTPGERTIALSALQRVTRFATPQSAR